MKFFSLLLNWVIVLSLPVVMLFGFFQVTASNTSEVIPIRLKYGTFDPLTRLPEIPESFKHSPGEGNNLYLIQFEGPVQPEWKKSVEETGVRFYDYIPEFTFIAWVPEDVISRLQSFPYVRWIGPYEPAYRLAESLQNLALSDADPSLELVVVTIPDADLDVLIAWINRQGGSRLYSSQNEFNGFLRVQLPASALNDLVMQKTVIWVEPYLEPTTLNDVASGEIMNVAPLRASLGLFGQNQVAAVSDTGLDVGTTGTAMSDDFEGQIVEGQAICSIFGGRTSWNDFNGHGTHVAGSVMGNGKLSGSDPAKKIYTGSYAGVAPMAKIVFQSVDDDPAGGLECVPNNLKDDLMGPAYAKGARIHSNSWGGTAGGSNPYGVYTSFAAAADQAAYAYNSMLILFSAGNSGADSNSNGVVDTDSLLTPATAKNTLTVGASENKRLDQSLTYGSAFGYPSNPIANDAMADDPTGMAAFSSRGPADDGRIKPDIVAPGTYVISARSHDSQAGTLWGVVNNHYLYSGGTSMSTPLTAGAATLAREWLVRIRSVLEPSAALLKAVLLNGALNISPGQYGTGSTQEIPTQLPNRVTGWGRLDLKASLSPDGKRQIWLRDEKTGLNSGQFLNYDLDLGSQVVSLSDPYAPEQVLVNPLPQPAISSAGDLLTPERDGLLQGFPVDAVQATSQLLLNPGFEEDGTHWLTNNSNYAFIATFSHSGSKSAVEYGGSGNWVILYQSLAFPPEAINATIKFYAYGTSLAAGDAVYAVLRDSGGNLIDSHLAAVANNAWNQFTWNISPATLSSIKGQQIWVSFESIAASASSRVYFDDTELLTDLPDPAVGGPLRITLVWTDYPGSTSAARALVNDLDLEVIAPDGTQYRGNAGLYTSGQCLRDGAWDACNNVEGIYLSLPQNGRYTVYVRGINVPNGPQPFALAASGDCLNTGCLPLDKYVFLPAVIQSK